MTDPIQGLLGSDAASGIKPSTETKSGQTAAGTTAGAGGTGTDSANVGETQSLLQTINAAAAAVPTVNQDRVDALKEAIAHGTYQVDPQQVAKGLLTSEAALGGAAVKE